MNTKFSLCSLAIASTLVSGSVMAEIRFNGFASVVAGQTMGSDEALYGYDNDISFSPDTKFALQASSNLGDKLSATAQIMARGADDYEAEFEWAYLTYQLTNNTQISAGRLRVPFYRYSDFLDVGYAYPWIRPPQSVYRLSFSTYEGLSVVNTTTLGDWDSTAQFVTGSYSGDITVGGEDRPSELNNMVGINWTLEKNWFSGRIGYFMADNTIDISNSPRFEAINNLTATLNSLGLNQQASNMLVDEDTSTFLALGMGIDYNNFLFDAEYIELRVDDSFVAEQDLYYVMAGYRYDSMTFHVTYGNEDAAAASDSLNQVPLELNGTPLVDPNTGLPLQTLVNQVFQSNKEDSETLSLGLRYNFHPAAAFKVDYTTRDDNLTNTDAALISTGIDLVF